MAPAPQPKGVRRPAGQVSVPTLRCALAPGPRRPCRVQALAGLPAPQLSIRRRLGQRRRGLTSLPAWLAAWPLLFPGFLWVPLSCRARMEACGTSGGFGGLEVWLGPHPAVLSGQGPFPPSCALFVSGHRDSQSCPCCLVTRHHGPAWEGGGLCVLLTGRIPEPPDPPSPLGTWAPWARGQLPALASVRWPGCRVPVDLGPMCPAVPGAVECPLGQSPLPDPTLFILLFSFRMKKAGIDLPLGQFPGTLDPLVVPQWLLPFPFMKSLNPVPTWSHQLRTDLRAA